MNEYKNKLKEKLKNSLDSKNSDFQNLNEIFKERNKMVQFYATISGVVAGFGFSSIGNVQNYTQFYISEFILLGIIVYCINITRLSTSSEVRRLHKNVNIKSDNIELMSKALYTDDTLLIHKLLKNTDYTNEHSSFKPPNERDDEDPLLTKNVYTEYKLNFILYSSAIAYILLLTSFINFCV